MIPMRRIALLALALPLVGCVTLGPKPPRSLITLNAAAALPAGPARTTSDRSAIGVAAITGQPAIMTQRVMVQDGNDVAYLKDAQWAAAPTQLFRALLAETITSRIGRVVPAPRVLAVQPNTRLSGSLVRFGLDGPGQAVVVTFDAALVHTGSDQIQARRFSARVPVAGETTQPVAAAMNQAANQVATEVADWVGGG